jgi:hypothetical protein
MTETEQQVIEILTQLEVTADPWGSAIQAVDRAMGWLSADTRKFVEDLTGRGLIHRASIVVKGRPHDPRYCWKKGRP